MEAVKAVGSAFQQHVVAPLVTIRNDLFATLRTRPSIVSNQATPRQSQALQAADDSPELLHDSDGLGTAQCWEARRQAPACLVLAPVHTLMC